jgi:hypothetical protein
MQMEGGCFVAGSVVPDGRRESAVIVWRAVCEDESVRSARGGTKACMLLEIFAVRLCGFKVVRE